MEEKIFLTELPLFSICTYIDSQDIKNMALTSSKINKVNNKK
jgi:hypothetical protein